MQKHNVSETQSCFFLIYINKSVRFDYLYLLKLVYLYDLTFPEKARL